MTENELEYIEDCARKIRINIVKTIASLGVGHIGGSLSIADVLALLYFRHMNIDPKNPKLDTRDRFVLSKGHAGPALYATLALKGYFDEKELLTLNKPHTNLPSHADMNKTIGVDMTTGSLGQGFSCACGIAKGMKIKGFDSYCYTIVGDGESQEGQIWEAAMFASAQKLNNLIAFTDYNNMQIDGLVSEINDVANLKDKWQSFGFDTVEVDGHDLAKIDETIVNAKKTDKPSMIILKTIKGKGVDFIEELGFANHSANLSEEDAKKALDLLMKGGN